MTDRPTAAARGYDSQWRKLRAMFLRRSPLCVMCAQAGRTTLATVVDHIVPHKGDAALRLNMANLQALCKLHHDASKQRQDKRGGRVQGCDVHGVPLDPNHPWNR